MWELGDYDRVAYWGVSVDVVCGFGVLRWRVDGGGGKVEGWKGWEL